MWGHTRNLFYKKFNLSFYKMYIYIIMPNDPRVKFHKGGKICRNDLAYLKIHPECYGFITDRGPLRSGGGSGAGGGDGGGGGTPRKPPTPTIYVPPGTGPGDNPVYPIRPFPTHFDPRPNCPPGIVETLAHRVRLRLLAEMNPRNSSQPQT